MKSVRVWFGVLVSLLFLGLFFYRVDLRALLASLQEANYPLALSAVAVYFVSFLFRAHRWRFLLRSLKPLARARLLPVILVGYTANNLLPVRLGELVRAYYLGQREGVSKMATLATIGVERVLDGLTLLLLAAVAALFLPLSGILKGLASTAGVPWVLLALGLSLPFAIALLLLVLMASRPAGTLQALSFLSRPFPQAVQGRAMTLAGLFVSGLQGLRSPWGVGWLLLLSLPVWLTEAAVYLVAAYAFGIQHSLAGAQVLVPALLLTLAASNLVTSFPSSQGGVGPFEFFAKATLVLVGVPAAQATAFTVTLHLILLVPTTVVGLLYLWGFSTFSLAALVRQSTQRSPTERSVSTVTAAQEDGP